MILVDTSAWIDFFRGTGRAGDAVDQLLERDEVALCGPVLTELRRGLRTRTERAKVLSLFAGCHHLEEPDRLWEEAGELGFLLGRKGATIKSMDLLIATHALVHSTPILTTDSDFRTMKRAGVGLQLVEVG